MAIFPQSSKGISNTYLQHLLISSTEEIVVLSLLSYVEFLVVSDVRFSLW